MISPVFQSTHPVRGGTWLGRDLPPAVAFQSTHPVRGGTATAGIPLGDIKHFNPPTPCGVGPGRSRCMRSTKTFQSTHPVRGGTYSPPHGGRVCTHFNPPTPCGVGLKRTSAGRTKWTFQSTHPVRGGTPPVLQAGGAGAISIHPPRAGWDLPQRGDLHRSADFNPPTPCGVGHAIARNAYGIIVFQSTPPVRGGTRRSRLCMTPSPFQSTHPVRGGTAPVLRLGVHQRISIHPPRAGWDVTSFPVWYISLISIHPPRAGWDIESGLERQENKISIHPPRAGWDSNRTHCS